MAKPKVRIHYSVAYKDLWWCGKVKLWLELNDPRFIEFGGSNSRHFRTKRRAFAHARHLGRGARLTQLVPKSKGWLTRTWIFH